MEEPFQPYLYSIYITTCIVVKVLSIVNIMCNTFFQETHTWACWQQMEAQVFISSFKCRMAAGIGPSIEIL